MIIQISAITTVHDRDIMRVARTRIIKYRTNAATLKDSYMSQIQYDNFCITVRVFVFWYTIKPSALELNRRSLHGNRFRVGTQRSTWYCLTAWSKISWRNIRMWSMFNHPESSVIAIRNHAFNMCAKKHMVDKWHVQFYNSQHHFQTAVDATICILYSSLDQTKRTCITCFKHKQWEHSPVS